jgi:hypothetical protein
MAHVMPWDHHGMFGVGRDYTARLIKFMLSEMSISEAAEPNKSDFGGSDSVKVGFL